mmetsp:Transcript_53439/g.86533  ORF Transcript_53439/g.86533 Transcript_53439/m.86533 type:complete len:278 (+) Transcript_53439:1785-2618(+)
MVVTTSVRQLPPSTSGSSAVRTDCLKSTNSASWRLSRAIASDFITWPKPRIELLSIAPSRMRTVVGSSASFSAPGRSKIRKREKRCSSCAFSCPGCIVEVTWCSSMHKIAVARSFMAPNSLRKEVRPDCPTLTWCNASSSESTHLRMRLRTPRPSLMPCSSTSSSIFCGFRRSSIFSLTTSMYCMLSLCRQRLVLPRAPKRPPCACALSFACRPSKIPWIVEGIMPSGSLPPPFPEPSAVYVLPLRELPKTRMAQLTPSTKPGKPLVSWMSGEMDRS